MIAESKTSPDRSIISGFLFSAIFFAIAFVFWFLTGLEKSILVFHNAVYHNEYLLSSLKFITHAGIPIILVIYSILLLKYLREKKSDPDNLEIFLAIFFTLFIAGVAGDVLKMIIGRERPVVELASLIERVKPFRSLSFPSGHATKVMALTIPFLLFSLKNVKLLNLYKSMVLLVAMIVAYSRIALQAHYPSDVIGGAAFAFLFFPIAVLLAGKYFKNHEPGKVRNLIIFLICLAFILAFIEMSF